MDKIEVVRQKGRGVNHTSLIVFTEGERTGELLGHVSHKTKRIYISTDNGLGEPILTPEIMVLIGEAFKTFKW